MRRSSRTPGTSRITRRCSRHWDRAGAGSWGLGAGELGAGDVGTGDWGLGTRPLPRRPHCPCLHVPMFPCPHSGFTCYNEHMSKHSYVHLKDRLLDETAVAALAETFKVLGDSTRVRILDALAREEVAVCDLAQLLGLTQSAVSHQLRLLRGMRLVKSRRVGKHIYYVADDHHIVGLFEQGLEHVQERTSAALAEPRGRSTVAAAADRRVRRAPANGSDAARRLYRPPAPSASSTPSLHSRSKAWIAARRSRSSSGASRT